MSIAAPISSASGTRTRWTEVESGFHVGNRPGEFVGTIRRVTDGYAAHDHTGHPVGTFPTLPRARSAVEARAQSRPRGF